MCIRDSIQVIETASIIIICQSSHLLMAFRQKLQLCIYLNTKVLLPESQQALLVTGFQRLSSIQANPAWPCRHRCLFSHRNAESLKMIVPFLPRKIISPISEIFRPLSVFLIIYLHLNLRLTGSSSQSLSLIHIYSFYPAFHLGIYQ